jgi:hypothetical protein
MLLKKHAPKLTSEVVGRQNNNKTNNRVFQYNTGYNPTARITLLLLAGNAAVVLFRQQKMMSSK